MMTGSHLRIEQMGTNAMGVVLEGNPSKPEPEYFHVRFPGGEIYVARCTDGSYWAHTSRNREKDLAGTERKLGVLLDGRLDVEGEHTSEVDHGAMGHPKLEHLAIRIGQERLRDD